MQGKNPFNPSFGNVPPIFIDKDNKLKELISEIQDGFSQAFFITGVRGSGKTSFLSKISENLEKDGRCYCIDLLNEDGILTRFARKLYRINHTKMSAIFDVFDSVKIGNITLSKDKEVPDADEMLEELMESVQKQNKYVVVTIDEVSNSHAIEQFAKQYNALKRKGYPIYVLMTGLPDLVMDIQNNERLTFLLRTEKVVMQPLSNQDMTFKYQDVFECDFKVASRMAQLTSGYSYAFQLLGYIYFKYLKRNELKPNNDNLDDVINEYKILLFTNSYQKIFSGISDRDREYLIAINQSPTLKDAAKIMKKNPSYTSQYRRRMIEQYLIKPDGYGKVTYTLPLFSEYISETQKPDSQFYWKI